MDARVMVTPTPTLPRRGGEEQAGLHVRSLGSWVISRYTYAKLVAGLMKRGLDGPRRTTA